jgi:hypothetical protein
MVRFREDLVGQGSTAQSDFERSMLRRMIQKQMDGAKQVTAESTATDAMDSAGLPHATYNTGSSTLRFLAILSPTGETGPDVVDCFQEEPWKSLRPPIPYPSQQS